MFPMQGTDWEIKDRHCRHERILGRNPSEAKTSELSWEIEEGSDGITVKIKATESKLSNVKLWVCDSEDRDFRDNEFIENPVETEPANEIFVSVKYPETGFALFMLT